MIWVANFKFSSIELKLEGQSIAKKYMSSSITENSDVHTLKKRSEYICICAKCTHGVYLHLKELT